MDVIKLPAGIDFEILDNGRYALVTSNKERIIFNRNGERIRIDDEIKDALAWLKYFRIMGEEERIIVDMWYREQIPTTTKQEYFLNKVGDALATVNYDYKISAIEPSLDEEGNIYFMEGRPVGRGITFCEWAQKVQNFAPDFDSDISSTEELFLWYAYRVATNKWSLKYVTDDSSSDGNYYDSPKGVGRLEVSGAKIVGGERDGVGNTYKIVRGIHYLKICGGNFTDFGEKRTVSDISYCFDMQSITTCSTPVIVIKKWV